MRYLLCTTLLAAGLAGNVFVYGQDSIRIMRPDHMPCLVADLSRVGRMPVKKLDSRLVRPMPNGTPDGRPRLDLAPKRKRE